MAYRGFDAQNIRLLELSCERRQTNGATDEQPFFSKRLRAPGGGNPIAVGIALLGVLERTLEHLLERWNKRRGYVPVKYFERDRGRPARIQGDIEPRDSGCVSRLIFWCFLRRSGGRENAKQNQAD